MQFLQRANISFEIQHGNVMGIIKFSESLPWELDADILYDAQHKDNVLTILQNKAPPGVKIVRLF